MILTFLFDSKVKSLALQIFGSNPSCADYLKVLIDSLFSNTAYVLTKIQVRFLLNLEKKIIIIFSLIIVLKCLGLHFKTRYSRRLFLTGFMIGITSSFFISIPLIGGMLHDWNNSPTQEGIYINTGQHYVHRVGRTARAGREGYAVTFVTDNDRSLLKAILVQSSRVALLQREQLINKWCELIEKMEDQVASILREEREEMALRKAEMEVDKAENLITHRDEIFSRPKRTWFVTEKEKRLVANAGMEKEKGSKKKVMSAEEAEARKLKAKKKREYEKNLPRKKRRKLEASREMLEDEADNGGNARNNKEKPGISLVDLAYRRAKAAKGAKKAADNGKVVYALLSRSRAYGGKALEWHIPVSAATDMEESRFLQALSDAASGLDIK
ncbi:hypothetical protein LXL04_003168 [Taraxacum kok-saghyz]